MDKSPFSISSFNRCQQVITHQPLQTSASKVREMNINQGYGAGKLQLRLGNGIRGYVTAGGWWLSKIRMPLESFGANEVVVFVFWTFGTLWSYQWQVTYNKHKEVRGDPPWSWHFPKWNCLGGLILKSECSEDGVPILIIGSAYGYYDLWLMINMIVDTHWPIMIQSIQNHLNY